MRERFDRIEIIDLRGDVRAGPRGDVDSDQGVFNIQVGTAITIAIADGSKAAGTLADVRYTDTWGADMFSRRAKLDWLTAAAGEGVIPPAAQVQRGALDDLRPAPFENGEWLSVNEVFLDGFSGIEITRDHLSYGYSEEDLEQKIATFHTLDDEKAKILYSQSRKQNFSTARARHYRRDVLLKVSYRPFDQRILFNEQGYVDWPRPKFQAAWGAQNITIFVMPNATNLGPSAWCHGQIADRHAFRGSYGGYAFPLYDRRKGADATNISPVLLAALAECYGKPVSAADVFDAILCLLSATSYTRRFAEDLEDVFPHIPFPADHAVLMHATAIGREIRAVESFTRAPAKQPASFCRLASEPAQGGLLDSVTYREGEITLCADGTGCITGIPERVWGFAVSGYRVLPRWIDGRKGLPADLALIRELRDVAARIAEIMTHFDAADLVLNATLAHSLTRAELGFPAPPAGDEG